MGDMLGFIIWCAVGMFFVGLGISARFSKKPAGFWANIKTARIADVKKYNAAMCRLFCLFGIVFMLLGLPLLPGQNSAWILLSAGGVMFESIGAMIVYTLVIEKKYAAK